jgi:hypothetical protein
MQQLLAIEQDGCLMQKDYRYDEEGHQGFG